MRGAGSNPRPYRDRLGVSRAILDHAIACLVLVRSGDPHDPGATISTLVTFIVDAEARLPDLVADARDRGHTWNRIAERLGSTILPPVLGVPVVTSELTRVELASEVTAAARGGRLRPRRPCSTGSMQTAPTMGRWRCSGSTP